MTIDDLYILCDQERRRGHGTAIVCIAGKGSRTFNPVSHLDFVKVTLLGEQYWARGDGEIEIAVAA